MKNKVVFIKNTNINFPIPQKVYFYELAVLVLFLRFKNCPDSIFG